MNQTSRLLCERITTTACRIGLACLLTALTSISLLGQAPRTISFQGMLTDPSGNPVPDTDRDVSFRIYASATGGPDLWGEDHMPVTHNGVFQVTLGLETPISGLNFADSLWLEIQIFGDPPMTPRTLLSSAPSALGLVMPYQGKFVVQTLDLEADGSEGLNEDITVYAEDAQLGLYSTNGGGYGSGIQLGQIEAGELADKWSIVRGTSTGTYLIGDLIFTFGNSPSYAANDPKMMLTDHGWLQVDTLRPLLENKITVGDIQYDFYVNTANVILGPEEFHPMFPSNNGLYSNSWFTDGAYFEVGYTGNETLVAPVRLPKGAKIENMFCYVYDADADDDFDCQLIAQRLGTGEFHTMYNETQFIAGGYSYVHTLFQDVSYPPWASASYYDGSYTLAVQVSGFDTINVGSMRLQGVDIIYVPQYPQ